jgi:hypothetical protein
MGRRASTECVTGESCWVPATCRLSRRAQSPHTPCRCPSLLGLLHCVVFTGHCCIRQYQGCVNSTFFRTNMAMRGLVSSLRLPLLVQHYLPVSGPLVAALACQQHRQIHAGRLTNPWEEVRANPRLLPKQRQGGTATLVLWLMMQDPMVHRKVCTSTCSMQLTKGSFGLLNLSAHHAAVSCRCCVWLSQTQRSSMRSSTH